jgi:hypothetical protein
VDNFNKTKQSVQNLDARGTLDGTKRPALDT